MDFEGLFWIALIIFYFMTRVLGGKKKPSPRPTGERRPTLERTGEPRTSQEPELDEALREIRRALGFPVEEPEPERPPEPEPAPAPDLREARTQGSRDTARQRERDAREVSRQQQMLDRARQADKKSMPAIPKPKVARRPGPIGAHPMESSFAEEEIFERRGPHSHKEPPPDYALQATYDVATRQRARLKRRLRGRKSLQEAFVLKEVLDKPLAMRTRR